MGDQSGSEMEWTWLLDAYEADRRDLIDERVAEVQNDRATWLFYMGMMSVGKQTAECCGAVAEEKDEEIQASKSEDETKGICEMADYEAAQHAETDCAARVEVVTELSVTWAERAWRKPLSRMIVSAMRRLERYKRAKAGALLKEWSSRMKAGRRAEKNRARRGTKRKNKLMRTLMAVRDLATSPRMLADVVARLKAGLIQSKREEEAQRKGTLADVVARLKAGLIQSKREEEAQRKRVLADVVARLKAGLIHSEVEEAALREREEESDEETEGVPPAAILELRRDSAFGGVDRGSERVLELKNAVSSDDDWTDNSSNEGSEERVKSLEVVLASIDWGKIFSNGKEAQGVTACGGESDEIDVSEDAESDNSDYEDAECSTWEDSRRSKNVSGCAGVRSRKKKVMCAADYAWSGFDVG
jgi:hypothetical protein